LKPHPNIGLDVFHDVPNMEVAVGIRQGGGNEDLTQRHGARTVGAKGSILVPDLCMTK
jgi:hypothetical protein